MASNRRFSLPFKHEMINHLASATGRKELSKGRQQHANVYLHLQVSEESPVGRTSGQSIQGKHKMINHKIDDASLFDCLSLLALDRKLLF